MNFTIESKEIYSPELFNGKTLLAVENGRVSTLGEVAGAKRLLVPGYRLVPGLVEVQINGAFGEDFTDDPTAIWRVGARLPELGITTFLPTVITSPLETVHLAMDTWMTGPPVGYTGARIPGLHLEGPFLNPQKKGAHNPKYLRTPTISDIQNWDPQHGVRLVTLAPELPDAVQLIEALSARGVVVSAGHSQASLVEARAGFAAGILCGTHLFNAMPPLGHREPGLAGALLDEKHLFTGLIVDGIHVAPEMVRLTWRMKAPDRLVLVTDAMAALGVPGGEYVLAGAHVRVDEKSARLADGTLAGSILKPLDAVYNLQQYARCSFASALTCFTRNPAQMLRLETVGRVQPGSPADMLLLDEENRLAATMVGGELVYSAPWAKFNWDENTIA
ncbi:MAG: N-acetylglucosamine-6-phosphate deacetylase [Chloroflexi bacterium HGW-Chloroflexi-10]|nr:MAG: N-acetylglucosamine-6-phosphate deacetylase [Chloroflexi bacterium HGW-Chloroflexi-10]